MTVAKEERNKRIKQLIKLSNEKGFLTKKDIDEVLLEDIVAKSTKATIIHLFRKMDIEVIDDIDEDTQYMKADNETIAESKNDDIGISVNRNNCIKTFTGEPIDGIESFNQITEEYVLKSTENRTHTTFSHPTKQPKIIRFLDFLIEVANLSSRPIMHINKYEHVLWLNSIPHEKECYCQLWGTSEENDSDIWIEIKKAKEPQMPSLPSICEKWVNKASLSNLSDYPVLQEEIREENSLPEDTTSEPQNKMLYLKDYPEVSKEFETYIENKWDIWRDEYVRWKVVHDIYSKLFTIHQAQLKLGEDYELILGIGLLKWMSPVNDQLCRHLITTKIDLIFEAKSGKFIISSSPDNTGLKLEREIIDAEILPVKNEKNIVDLLQQADNPFDKTSVIPVLKSLANTMSKDGEFIEKDSGENGIPSFETSQKLIIELAPAVILRKRSVHIYVEVLKKMKGNVVATGRVTNAFGSIGEDFGDYTDDESCKIDSDNNNKKLVYTDSSIFFPKLFNQEQEKIIKKFDYASGVLVKGPPGTGKSHTIVNLICHLLAQGKRILITAKTPRALKVLHNLMPDQIKPLCVSLLGSGPEEKQSIEKSVNGILYEQEYWDQDDKDIEIANIQEKLESLRSERARIRNRIIDIADKDNHAEHVVGVYKGTATEIVSLIKEHENAFSWFTDKIPHTLPFPLSADDVCFLKKKLNLLSELNRQYEKLPDIGSELPEGGEFKKNFDQYLSIRRQTLERKHLLATWEAEHLRKLPKDVFGNCSKQLAMLYDHIKEIDNFPEQWVKRAVFDLLSGNQIMWNTYRKELEGYFQIIERNFVVCDNCDFNLSDVIPDNKLLKDAKNLKDYLQKGGKVKKIFNNKIVRENKYIIENITVDSEICKSIPQLDKLIAYVEMTLNIAKAWALLEANIPKVEGLIILQKNKLNQILDLLKKIDKLFEEVKQTKELIRSHLNSTNLAWYTCDDIGKLLSIIESIRIENLYKTTMAQIKFQLRKIKELSKNGNSHPLYKKAYNVLSDIITKKTDYSGYFNLLQEIDYEKKKSVELKKLLNVIEQLKLNAPILANLLTTTYQDTIWNERLAGLHKAWEYQQAHSWIFDYLDEANVKPLEQKFKVIEDDIRHTIAQLASLKAWSYCIKGMSREHREHFVAWQQQFRKIRKTGKYLNQQKRMAQEHLNQCKDAIPCWIMPLFRVYDTVAFDEGIFDVVIIDEASQCGIDSLPVLYLGKKVIIVGDDKQIAPEIVSDKSKIYMLQEKYLDDFIHKSSFDLETSLFAHAQRRFGTNMIQLREHFRCMPEIIRFCNDNFYSDHPLIPLKQYPPNRLNPIVHVYVDNGERDGSSGRAINKNEAQRLIQEVIKCCSDSRYSGKTMGVISLLGSKGGQIPYIEQELSKRLGEEEFEKRKIIIGDPYSFQGDERDIIFLTMVVATNARFSALTKPEDERRFNVAVSRAKEQLWLFHSVKPNDLSSFCLRRKLLDHFYDPMSYINRIEGVDIEELQKKVYYANRQIERPPKPFDSWFEVDVALAIAQQGYKVIPQHEVGSKRIDLVVQDDTRQMAVECDGDFWHGRDKYSEDMERQRMLERCNWSFFRIREFEFRLDPESVIKELKKELNRIGIRPVNNVDGVKEEKLPNESTFDELSLKSVDSFLDDSQETAHKIIYNNSQDTVEIQKEPSQETDYDDYTGFGDDILVEYEKYPVLVREGNIYDVDIDKLALLLISIIKIESPIHEEELITRMRECWGCAKAGRRIREIFDRAKRYLLKSNTVFVRNRFFYHENKNKLEDIKPRRRNNADASQNPLHISPEEYAIVSFEIIKKYAPIGKPELEQRVSLLFGYKRTTSHMKSAISLGLNCFLKDSDIVLEAGYFSLKGSDVISRSVAIPDMQESVAPSLNLLQREEIEVSSVGYAKDDSNMVLYLNISAEFDYANMKVYSFIFEEKRYYVSNWKSLLITICDIMRTNHTNNFYKVLNLFGKNRPYFCTSSAQKALRDPEQIKGTNIYVETNLSANQIVKITIMILELFGYKQSAIRIQCR